MTHPSAAAIRGNLTGEAVYDTLLFRDGPPRTWHLHLQRLQRDAAAMGLACPDELALLAAIATQVPDGQLSRVRVTLLADGGEPLLEAATSTRCQITARPVRDDELSATPWRLVTRTGARHPGLLSGVKKASLAEDLLHRRAAQGMGYDEALLCTDQGTWSEAVTSCVVVGLADGTLHSPSAAAFPVSSTTLQALSTELPVTRSTLNETSPVAWAVLLNAVWGARPVSAINGKTLGAPPDAILARARNLVAP